MPHNSSPDTTEDMSEVTSSLLDLETICKEKSSNFSPSDVQGILPRLRRSAYSFFRFTKTWKPAEKHVSKIEEVLDRHFVEIAGLSHVKVNAHEKAQLQVSLAQIGLFLAVYGERHQDDVNWFYNMFLLALSSVQASYDVSMMEEAFISIDITWKILKVLEQRVIPKYLKKNLEKYKMIFKFYQFLVYYRKEMDEQLQYLIVEFNKMHFSFPGNLKKIIATACYNLGCKANEKRNFKDAVFWFKFTFATAKNTDVLLRRKSIVCLAWSYYRWNAWRFCRNAIDVMDLLEGNRCETIYLQLYFAVSGPRKDDSQIWYYTTKCLKAHLENAETGEMAKRCCEKIFSLLFRNQRYEVLLFAVELFRWDINDVVRGSIYGSVLCFRPYNPNGRFLMRNFKEDFIRHIYWLCAFYAVHCLMKLKEQPQEDIIKIVATTQSWDSRCGDKTRCTQLIHFAEEVAVQFEEEGNCKEAVAIYELLYIIIRKYDMDLERSRAVYNSVLCSLRSRKRPLEILKLLERVSQRDKQSPAILVLELYLQVLAGNVDESIKLSEKMGPEIYRNPERDVIDSVIRRCCAETERNELLLPVFSRILSCILKNRSLDLNQKIAILAIKIKADYDLLEPGKSDSYKNVSESIATISSYFDVAQDHSTKENLKQLTNIACSFGNLAYNLSQDLSVNFSIRFQLACSSLKIFYLAALQNPENAAKFGLGVFNAVLIGARDTRKASGNDSLFLEKIYNYCLVILKDYRLFHEEAEGKGLSRLHPLMEDLLLLYELHIYINMCDAASTESFLGQILIYTPEKVGLAQAAAEMLLLQTSDEKSTTRYKSMDSISGEKLQNFLFQKSPEYSIVLRDFGYKYLVGLFKWAAEQQTIPLQKTATIFHRIVIHEATEIFHLEERYNAFLSLCEQFCNLVHDSTERLLLHQINWFATSFWNTGIRTLKLKTTRQGKIWFDLILTLTQKFRVLWTIYNKQIEELLQKNR